eukprot:6191250-Prymnesium_polylepis.1
MSHIGGLYTRTLAGFAAREWLMCTPDASMPVGAPDGRLTAPELRAALPAQRVRTQLSVAPKLIETSPPARS